MVVSLTPALPVGQVTTVIVWVLLRALYRAYSLPGLTSNFALPAVGLGACGLLDIALFGLQLLLGSVLGRELDAECDGG
jgi:hypothetical protein